MAKKATGRHRADAQVSVLESFELRSRRSIRESERARQSRKSRKFAKKLAKQERAMLALNAVSASPSTDSIATASSAFTVRPAAKVKIRNRRWFRNTITMATASGLFATAALPAYAYNPDVAAMAQFTTTNAEALAAAENTQNLTVAAVNTVKFVRGAYKSASAAEIARQETLNNYRLYTGPTAADFLDNPPYSKVEGSTVLKVAAKFVGVPYVFGGSTPGGFDCSGYVMFVFAHFGIALPHSVHEQARIGIKIKPEDAMPGDVVIMSDLSHSGIYAGNGNFYHAPRPGDTVKLAPIFTSNIFFVRFGTK